MSPWEITIGVIVVAVVLGYVIRVRHPFRRHRWSIVRTQNETTVDYWGSDADQTIVWEVCTRRQCRGYTTRTRWLDGYWTKEDLGVGNSV